MKFINKLLPVVGLTAVAAVPMITTSCSKVWEDMFSKQYQVNFKAAEAAEVTLDEATKMYFDYFRQHTDQIIPDCYWGVSAYCREELQGYEDIYTVRNYLTHIDYFNIDSKENRLSFKLHSQIEVKIDSSVGQSSYSIDTYDLDWEIQNLEFGAICYKETRSWTEHENIWAMCPVKYHIEEEVPYWDELTGDEKIIFEFKTVKKGFGEDGAQNFVREISESAVVDAAHRYVPQLTEVYTNSLLLETYYLSDLTLKK